MVYLLDSGSVSEAAVGPGWILGSATTGTGVAGDENALTSREMDVLRLVALGWSNERIGDELGVTLNTVRYWRPRRSRSWHSLHLSARLPSGASILSLPHSQVRSRMSNARSSSRERLASGLQCSAMMESYLWEKRA